MFLPIYTLVLGPDARGARRTIQIEAVNPAQLVSHVERQECDVQAEIWESDRLLCKVEGTRDAGLVWTVSPAKNSTEARVGRKGKEGRRPDSGRLPGGL